MKAASKTKQPSQDIFSAAEIVIKCMVWYINTILKLCTLFTTDTMHPLLCPDIGPCDDGQIDLYEY